MSNLPEEEIRIKEKAFLEKNIFQGLNNLNNGFDSQLIKYFSESEFEIVLKRVEELGLGIYGIEPWLNGEFYDASINEDFNLNSNDPNWYKVAFSKFKDQNKNLLYAATYNIPIELIEVKQ